jgi:GAF domain-containing protein
MSDVTRDHRLLDTLVTLADTLVAGYDVVDLLQTLVDRCSDLVSATAAGVLLRDPRGSLEVIAASDEGAQTMEVLQVASGSGPCVHCADSGETVSIADMGDDERWPDFNNAASRVGFVSLLAVPLRLREITIGSMNLFRATPGAFADDDARAARALADVATIGILQERAVRESDVVRVQLQRALDSRVVIEQAKGVVSYRRSVDMGAAFDLIRGHARANRLGLSDVAEQIVQRRLDL